jgi:hypothetical protein
MRRGGRGKVPGMTFATAITAGVNLHAAASGTVRGVVVMVMVMVCRRHRVVAG